METKPKQSGNTLSDVVRTFGFWALLCGGAAILFVFAQIMGIDSQPRPSAASKIGEIAGEIRNSAWRSFLGLPARAEPAVVPTNGAYLPLAGPMFAVVAIILAAISGVMRENWRLPAYAAGFGISAILMQYFWSLALMIVGAILIIAIIKNMSNIFDFG